MNLPPYPSFPEISTHALLLRDIYPYDIPALIEISFYDGKPAKNYEDALHMQQKINADYEAGNSIHWGIVDLKTREMVGTCGYYRGFAQDRGELGCVMRPEFRGQGYMRAALELAIHFGLHQMGLEKIIAITTLDNLPAIRLLTRLKFAQTGVLQDNYIEYVYME